VVKNDGIFGLAGAVVLAGMCSIVADLIRERPVDGVVKIGSQAFMDAAVWKMLRKSKKPDNICSSLLILQR
jgi:deoxyhypusine synthase